MASNNEYSVWCYDYRDSSNMSISLDNLSRHEAIKRALTHAALHMDDCGWLEYRVYIRGVGGTAHVMIGYAEVGRHYTVRFVESVD